MTLTLTPEQERRLVAYARQRQKSVESVIDELIPQTVSEEAPQFGGTPETWQETFARWAILFQGRDLPDPPSDAFSRASFYEEQA